MPNDDASFLQSTDYVGIRYGLFKFTKAIIEDKPIDITMAKCLEILLM